MNFDPAYSFLDDFSAHDDEWALYTLFSRVIFDTLVRDIVRGHYEYGAASHVTLHLEDGVASLFVHENGRTHLQQDDALYDWVVDLVAVEVLSLPADEVETIYIDGAVGAEEPYLYISGGGVMIATGEPVSRGKLL